MEGVNRDTINKYKTVIKPDFKLPGSGGTGAGNSGIGDNRNSPSSTPGNGAGTGGNNSPGPTGNNLSGEATKPLGKGTGIPVIGGPQTIPKINIPDAPVPPVKERKKRESVKNEPLDRQLEGNVRLVLSAGFDLTAKSLNNPVWEVSQEEAKSISEPMTRILQRLGMSDSLSKYGDILALVTATTVVIAPRVLITQTLKKERGNNGRKQQQPPTPFTQRENQTPATPISRPNKTESPPVFVGALKDSLNVCG